MLHNSVNNFEKKKNDYFFLRYTYLCSGGFKSSGYKNCVPPFIKNKIILKYDNTLLITSLILRVYLLVSLSFEKKNSEKKTHNYHFRRAKFNSHLQKNCILILVTVLSTLREFGREITILFVSGIYLYN